MRFAMFVKPSSFLILVAAFLAVASPSVAASYDCALSDPIRLDDNGQLELQQFVNENEGIYTMKLTYYGGQAYVAVGINQNGIPAMTPSIAVIGRAESDGSDARVEKYAMTPDSGVQLAASQEGLFNTSFIQTADTSTLTFTQRLSEPGQVTITDDSQWIYAVGLSDNRFSGHVIRGSFRLPLSRSCTLLGEDSQLDNQDQAPDDDTALACPLTDPIPLDANGQLGLQQFVNPDEGTFTMKLTYYGGQAWIGIGINDAGLAKMTPATAVIGRADGEGVQVYRMTATSGVQLATQQTSLLNASFVQTDDTSTLTFTQRLNEPGQVPITDDSQWIFAVGFPGNRWMGHSLQGSFQLALTPTCDKTTTMNDPDATAAQAGNSIILEQIETPDRQLWVTHGVLMALAWGLCAPIAIGASICRAVFARLGLNTNGLWFQIHFFMNVGTTLLTIAGFIIAVVAKQQQQIDDEPVHFQAIHAKMGLAIFIMVLLQSLAGRFRPSLPKTSSPSSPHATDPNFDKESKDPSKKQSIQSDELDKTERDPSAPMDLSTNSFASPEDANKKSSIRIIWEWGHRLTGLALLGMAWYNCHTGIVWSSVVWQEAVDWTGIFWGVVGGLGGMILATSIFLKATE